ncbi:MAG: galactose mutarotase [Phaeodactylibacter sp.]|nr:galactose mutarotase [Phaeodactylibacter sp.]MCB9273121.1 galactose mutarotase [Lewinellaceae bacterium]
MRPIPFLFILSLASAGTGCNNGPAPEEEKQEPALSITTSDYGQAAEGPAQLFTLKNKNGMEVDITNYGGAITRLLAPGKDGQLADIVLGFDKLEDYQKDHPYFGAIIGRYGNRIAKGKFSIDGHDYTLAANNGANALHGGPMGFHKRLWQAKEIQREGYVGLELSRLSPDMEEGYPGNLQATVRYLLNNDNELHIEYEATADKPTVVNLTNHSYFNMKGAGNGDILGHELMINASAFTPVDSTLIPTGELRPVEGTPFDFRTPTAIGERVNADDEQIRFGLGYDHNFVLDRKGEGLELAASVYEPTTGRFMEVLTTEPGLQFYCGNFLDGSNVGKGGVPYAYRTGFCLETQHYPDSPNQAAFPSTVLRPGEKYETRTVYRFSAK